MRADPAGWPYQDPEDDPDWTGGGDGWVAGGAAPGPPYGEDHPSWPAGTTGPNWTTGDGSWTAAGPGPGGPYVEDHPSWPAGRDHPDWPRGGRSGLPGWEPPAPHHDRHRRAAPPRGPAARAQARARAGPGEAQHWSGQQAAPAYGNVVADDGWAQVLPAASAGRLPRPTANGPAELLDPVRQDTGGLRNEDSVRLAERILSDAGSQAASVRREAMEQANAIREAAEREAEKIRRQAAYEAGAAREAERKAGELKRQAAAQAAAMREAAEREADELRAGAIRLAAELGEVAAYVTRTLDMPAIPAPERRAPPRRHVGEDFAIPAAPAAEPEAWAAPRPRPQARNGRYYTEDRDSGVMPGAGPEAWQAGETWEPEGWAPESPPARPRGRQAARPGLDGRATTRPATRPERRPTRPATKPAKRTDKPARSRQYRTMRAFAGTITALVLLALATGAYQLATRGYTFFVFRSAGTGATDNNAIFPGIIPTPKPSPAHHHPTTRPGQPGPRRAHHRRHHRGEPTTA